MAFSFLKLQAGQSLSGKVTLPAVTPDYSARHSYPDARGSGSVRNGARYKLLKLKYLS
jgi:hypothetical protein